MRLIKPSTASQSQDAGKAAAADGQEPKKRTGRVLRLKSSTIEENLFDSESHKASDGQLFPSNPARTSNNSGSTPKKRGNSTPVQLTEGTQTDSPKDSGKELDTSGKGEPKSNSSVISPELAEKIDKRLGAGASEKIEQFAKNINASVRDIIAMFYSESGLNTTSTNSIGAAGIQQILPSTLKLLGYNYTPEQVASLPLSEQLKIAEKFYQSARQSAGIKQEQQIDGGTIYALNWLPSFANRSDGVVLSPETAGKYYESWYNSNSGLDIDKDGIVTRSELQQRLDEKFNEFLTYA